MKVTHLDARYAGSVHDSFAFKSSRVYIKAELGSYKNFFLLGDSGYVNNNQQQSTTNKTTNETTRKNFRIQYQLVIITGLVWRKFHFSLHRDHTFIHGKIIKILKF